VVVIIFIEFDIVGFNRARHAALLELREPNVRRTNRVNVLLRFTIFAVPQSHVIFIWLKVAVHPFF